MKTNRLKELRENAGKNQSEIAEILNMTCRQYSLYEKGERHLKTKHIIMLCKYYNVSTNYILGLPDNLPYPKR